jgi:hypothetical protein
MLWFKRNLFLAVGGLVTLLALGCGMYYLWSSIQENKSIEAALEEKKDALEKISRADPFPSQANISIVRGESQKLREMITKMRGYFSTIPAQRVTGQSFATLLNNTTDELRKKAEQMSVIIPGKKYAFSFEAQKDKLKFGDRSFPTLPEQLAEIKVIVQILFDAKINKLVNVSRSPVSVDDEMARGTSAADYHELRMATNPITGTISRPYRFQFECFSSELATVLENLYKSKYALHVKALQVEPSAPAPGTTPPGASPAAGPQPITPATPLPTRRGPRPGVAGAPGAAPAPGAAEIKTVLAERLLKADMLVEVIQPGK